jgi:hypothetical protein
MLIYRDAFLSVNKVIRRISTNCGQFSRQNPAGECMQAYTPCGFSLNSRPVHHGREGPEGASVPCIESSVYRASHVYTKSALLDSLGNKTFLLAGERSAVLIKLIYVI